MIVEGRRRKTEDGLSELPLDDFARNKAPDRQIRGFSHGLP